MSARIQKYLEFRLDQYLADLEYLAAIDSGSYDKSGVDEVQRWIAGRLERSGFQVCFHEQYQFGDDLVARRSGTGSRRVMLIGHADTVYPDGTADCRPMKIEGDVVRGPGTCDMKAGILSGIYAIEALDHIGWNEIDLLTYVVVSDEEVGDRHSIELLESEGRRHDVVLTLEAARENGDIVTSRKACCQYLVEVEGRAAHAGVEPEKGRSATLALARIVDNSFKLNDFDAGTTVNPGTLSGGHQPNVVADHATGRFDLRAWTNGGLASLQTAFEEIAEDRWVPDTRVSATIEPNSLCPAMEYTDGVKRLEQVAVEIAQDVGFAVSGAATGGGSDASFACRYGTPGLDGLGPVGGLDHGPDEYILKSSIVPRTTLLGMLIQRIGEDSALAYDERSN